MIKWLALLGFSVLAFGLLGGAYVYRRANPPLPVEAKRYKKVSLYVPQNPHSSAEMEEYLRQSGDMEMRNMRNLDRLRAEIQAGRWPAEMELLSWVQAIDLDIKRFDGALRSKGCFPHEKTTRSASEQGDSRRFRYSRFVWGVELMTYQALLFFRRGAAPEAIKRLEMLHENLLRYEMACGASLLVINVIAASVQIFLDGVLFSLRYEGLVQTERERLLEILFAWATRPPLSFAMALRQEAHQAKKIIEIFRQQIKDQIRDKQRDNDVIPKEVSDAFLDQIHVVDFSQTKRLIEQKYRCLVSKVEQPLSSDTFRSCAVERYLERLRKKKKDIFLVLRRNLVGHLLLSQMTPRYRMFLLGWYASKCRAAAHLALWYRSLNEDEKEQVHPRYLFEPENPYTQAPFGASLVRACALPAWVTKVYPSAENIAERGRPPLPMALKPADQDKGP
jgi:hypothetical protein